MDDLVFGELTLAPEAAAGTLRVHWRGKSVDRQPGKTLDPWFEGVVEEAAREGHSFSFDAAGYEDLLRAAM